MSYEGPIRIIEGKLTSKIEDDIMTVVKSYGIEVDKDELVRALRYDREQYDKGFDDGRADRFFHSVKPYKDGKRWRCGQCSIAISRYWRFCQFCGQKIGWDEVSDETDRDSH